MKKKIENNFSDMDVIIDRILAALNRRGMTQAELARRVGVTRSGMYQFLKKQAKTITVEQIYSIANALEVSAMSLQFGEDIDEDQKKLTKKTVASHDLGGKISYWKPLLQWHESTQWRKMMEIARQDTARDHIPVDMHYDPDCFPLQIERGSMLPRFREGDYIIIDPHSSPSFGSFSLVKLQDSGDVIFAQYFEQEDKVILKFTNTQYPDIITHSANVQFIGNIIEKLTRDFIK